MLGGSCRFYRLYDGTLHDPRHFPERSRRLADALDCLFRTPVQQVRGDGNEKRG